MWPLPRVGREVISGSMAPLDASSDDEEEPAPGTSDRDHGEHQRDAEGSVSGLDGLGKALPGMLGESRRERPLHRLGERCSFSQPAEKRRSCHPHT